MSFKLEWENSLESQFQTIYRANEPFEFDRLPDVYAAVGKGVAEFTDTAIEQFTPYYYRVASNRELKGKSEQVVSRLVSAGFMGGPSLNLDFAGQAFSVMQPSGAMAVKPFSDIVTFSRASGGGRFNSSGVYEWVGNDVPRLDYDPVTLQPLGLLIEEARTNLNTYSYQINSTNYDTTTFPSTLVANSTTSPSGLVDASLLSPTTSNTAHAIFRLGPQLSYIGGTSYSASIFAKNLGGRYLQLTLPSAAFGASQYANYDLQDGLLGTVVGGTATITPVGNGWYRCAFSASATATAAAAPPTTVLNQSATGGRIPSFVGNPANGIYIWGAQLEAGAFPTSYIPTEATQVTRAADVASVNTLSPWYNASEGTLFVDGDSTWVGAVASYIASLNNGTTSNIIAVRRVGTSLGGLVTDSAVAQANLLAAYTTGSRFKAAIAYKADDFAFTKDGAAPLLDSVGTIPAITKLDLGSLAGSLRHNGHIRSLRYWPRRLSNAELQQVTA